MGLSDLLRRAPRDSEFERPGAPAAQSDFEDSAGFVSGPATVAPPLTMYERPPEHDPFTAYDLPEDPVVGVDDGSEPQAVGLTAAMVDGVRFTRSKPHGYYYAQVDTFVTQVHETLEAREAQIANLREQLSAALADADRWRYETQRARMQAGVFEVSGDAVRNPDGSLATVQGADVQEMQRLQHAAAAAEAEVHRVQQERDQALAQVETLRDEADESARATGFLTEERDRAQRQVRMLEAALEQARVLVESVPAVAEQPATDDPGTAVAPASSPEASWDPEPTVDAADTTTGDFAVNAAGLPAVSETGPAQDEHLIEPDLVPEFEVDRSQEPLGSVGGAGLNGHPIADPPLVAATVQETTAPFVDVAGYFADMSDEPEVEVTEPGNQPPAEVPVQPGDPLVGIGEQDLATYAPELSGDSSELDQLPPPS